MEDAPRPGRPFTVSYRRMRVTARIGLLAPAIAVGGYFLITIPETYSRHAMAHVVGYLLFPIVLYLLLLAFRVATWPRFHIKLSRRRLEFPSLHGLFAKQIELDLTELDAVGFVTTRYGSSSAVWSGGKRYGVPTAPLWLPPPWSADAITRRISLRRAAALRGLGGPELAAAEAAWDEEGTAGVAVRRKGKKWKLLCAVEGRDDFARRVERGRLDDSAECVLADEVMPEWRAIRDAVLSKPKG